MKIRTGFVSNSSSSSFILEKRLLSSEQIRQIKKHCYEFLKLENYLDIYGSWLETSSKKKIKQEMFKRDLGPYDEWLINDTCPEDDTQGILECSTSMANFNLELFIESIGIPSEQIKGRGL